MFFLLLFFTSLFWFTFGSMYGDLILSRKFRYGKYLFYMFLLYGFFEMFYVSQDISKFVRIPHILLGIIGISSIYDTILGENFDQNNHNKIKHCCSFTFFIYLYHEPTLNVVRKLVAFPFHGSSLGFAISYIISPWIFALLAIYMGSFIKKIFPNIYSILVGGR